MLVLKSSDDRSRATEETDKSKINLKIAFKGVKPESTCANSLTSVDLDLVNVTAKAYQSNIGTSITPVAGEVNQSGDQVFLISNIVLDNNFKKTDSYNYFQIKNPAYLSARMCFDHQSSKMSTSAACDITLTNGTTYDFSNYPLIPGDLNQDGIVNSSDFSIVKQSVDPSSSNSCDKEGDLNYDGMVNSFDTSYLKQSLLQTDDEVVVDLSTITPTPTASPTPEATPTPTSSAPIEAPSDSASSIIRTANSDTLRVSIEKKSGYYVTRLWIRNPTSQIRKITTPGWRKYFETLATMTNREIAAKGLTNKTVVAINASGWHTPDVDHRNGHDYTSYGTFVMTNGVVLKNMNTDTAYPAHGYYLINGSGNLQVFNDNKTNRNTLYKEITSSGTKNTFAFRLGAIVNNNQVTTSDGSSAVRQMFCQIDKNNFIMLTIYSSSSIRNGAIILKNLGCRIGVNLDGGSSTGLVFKPAGATTVSGISGGGRKIADVLYVTD